MFGPTIDRPKRVFWLVLLVRILVGKVYKISQIVQSNRRMTERSLFTIEKKEYTRYDTKSIVFVDRAMETCTGNLASAALGPPK